MVLLGTAAWSQEFRATVSGRVTDASGASVPNTKITAINLATNETTNVSSDNSGAYTLPFLRPGQYRMTAVASGFKTYNRENLTVEVGRLLSVDILLEVGAMTDSVSVTAEAGLLETQTASRSGVVNQMQVSELPLNARNPFMLGSMMSGVVFRGAAIWQRPFDNGAIAEWGVNGGRQSNNEFMMDGAPNNAQAGGNNIAYVPVVDAVQEFSVQQNSYDAQYGKTGGGVFNVVLKTGGSQHHGVAWEFLRRKFLDANTFQGNAAGAQRANHLLDQYGFQLDGPVLIPKILTKESKVKLFYLGTFENYRENTPNPLTNSYPDMAFRTGDFSKLTNAQKAPILIYDPMNYTMDASGNPVRVPFAGNIIPQARINPVAQAVSKYMPTPNAATKDGFQYSTNNYLLPDYINHDKFYNLILKFDWNFGDKHRAFFRHASNDRTEDRAVNGIDNKVGTDGQQPFQRINDAYVFDWVSTLSPTLVMNIRASSNRFIEKGLGKANDGFDLKSLGFPSSLVSQLPGPTFFGQYQFTGYATLGRYQSVNITNNYNLAANITKIAGSHTMKFGTDLRRIHYILQDTGNILQFGKDSGVLTGGFNDKSFTQKLFNQGDATSGDAYASFLLGYVNGASNYPVFPFIQQWYFAPYFQDDWKVSRKLSLNLGLRWDYNGPASEKYNRLNRGFNGSVASPLANQLSPATLAMYPQLKNLKGGFEFAGVNGNSRLVANPTYQTLQPRIGVAYQAHNRLVVRGGYGLYFLNPNNDWLRYAGFQTNTPITNSLDGNRTPIPNVLSNPFPGGISTPSGSSLGALTFVGRNNDWANPNFRTPKVHQFSLGFQVQTSHFSSLELTYVGSRSVDLNNVREYNIPSLDFRKKCNILEGGSPAFCDQNVPNPFKGVAAFQGTPYYVQDSISNYNLNRPYPQFAGNLTQRALNGSKAWYNSFQANYNVRLRNLNLLANYTLSKTIEQYGWNDPYADVQQRGIYLNDRPHYFKLNAIYQLPFGKGQHWGAGSRGFVQKLISGWEATSFYTNASGEPADLPNSSNSLTGTNVIQLKDPKIDNVDWKANKVQGWKPCTQRIFNDGSTTSYNCNGSTDYYWLMLPSYAPHATPSRSGQIRKHHAFTMDSSINKNTQITERIRVQLRIEAFNVFNHNYFGRDTFNTDPTSPNFGAVFPSVVSNQNTFPRQIQIGLKVYW